MTSCKYFGQPGMTTILDTGTTCLQVSPQPGVIGSVRSNYYPFSIVIGRARRDPGKNFDGTPAEDMQYGDMPAKSAEIKKDPMFKKTDASLYSYMHDLMTSLSTGDMETVAISMLDKFMFANKGNYKSKILNTKVGDNTAFIKYHNVFLKEIPSIIGAQVLHTPHNVIPISMNLLHFSSYMDKITGLGITIHQVWSAKAELLYFRVDDSGNEWRATLQYTFYDHFGLDWEDIKKHGNDIFPKYHTGNSFKAWYILQHYRTAKPFITEITTSVNVHGSIVSR